jgi:hypothetical protein
MSSDTIVGWFTGRLPDEWFTDAPEIWIDRDEIMVMGMLPTPAGAGDLGDEARAEALRSRIEDFREESRGRRMKIAAAAEEAFHRKVSWGVRCGDREALFTHLAVPAMTRLRMPERRVLDVLVEAGVARSRSDALAWCVRLVGRHEGDWLAELSEAMESVRDVRERGPLA